MNKPLWFIPALAVTMIAGACSNADAGTDIKTVQYINGIAVDSDSIAVVAPPSQSESRVLETPAEIPIGAAALMRAYPDFVKGYDDNKILFADGTSMVYDDKKQKTFEQRLDNSDIEDMFVDAYSLPAEGESPQYLADGGRSRCDALFKKMYGNSAAAVERNLVTVDWFGQKVKFTKINGAADRLRDVANELASYPELRPYMKSSGSFYWRKVRGANRQSAHSYGIAFDIGVDKSDYWLWRNGNASETAKIKYRNRIPRKIAEIFAKHGFIWGGAWYHYDTMHFEYRPEILGK